RGRRSSDGCAARLVRAAAVAEREADAGPEPVGPKLGAQQRCRAVGRRGGLPALGRVDVELVLVDDEPGALEQLDPPLGAGAGVAVGGYGQQQAAIAGE